MPNSQSTNSSLAGQGAFMMLGVEQEFTLFQQGQPIDFRTLFRKAIQQTPSVPFRNREDAALIEAGYMLACDGALAELATVPINASGDGCLTLAQEVVRCRMHMLGLLKQAGVEQVAGYSTHVNITVPLGREEELAIKLAQTAGPALVLLMEARESPGLLIRPRRGRVEIGSEYIDNPEQLAAACVILTGVMQTLLQNNELKRDLPLLILKSWEPAVIRPGIFLPHQAYGGDMYVNGGAAQMELGSGASISAGEVLKLTSNSALQALGQNVSLQAMQTLRSVVEQAGKLPIETGADPSAIVPQTSSHPIPAEAQTIQQIALSPNIPKVKPLFVDWVGAAFASAVNNQPLIVGLPMAHIPEFLNAAQSNNLPNYIANMQSTNANLSSLEQLQTPEVYQNIDSASLSQQASNLKGGSIPSTILNSLGQLQSPGLYGNIDPNTLGQQATSIKGGNGSSKGGKAIFLPPTTSTLSQSKKLLPGLALLLTIGLTVGALIYQNLQKKQTVTAPIEAANSRLIETSPPVSQPEVRQPPVATEPPVSIMPSLLGGKVSYCMPQGSNKYVNLPFNSEADPKVIQTELTNGNLTVQIGDVQGECTVNAVNRLMTCAFPANAFTAPTTIINVLDHGQIIDVILFNDYCPAAGKPNNSGGDETGPTEPPVDTGSD